MKNLTPVSVLVFLALLLVSCSGHSSENLPFDVTDISPADGATNVALNTSITVSFSIDLEWGSVYDASFFVYDETNRGRILGEIIASSPNTILFVPYAELQPNSLHTINITAELEDVWGNYFQETYTSSFTTGS